MIAIYPGRPRNAEATRAAILAAARRRFARESYDNVGIRDIAADAGVDAALVPRYFGSKEELFAAILNRPEKVEGMADFFGGSLDDIAERTADLVLAPADDDDKIEDFIIMLRSISSATAADIVRRIIEDRCHAPLCDLLDGDRGSLRARILGSVTLGFVMNRMIWGEMAETEAEKALVHDRIVELVKLAIREL